MDLNDVERIDFNALGGADNITVNDLSGTDVERGRVDLADGRRRRRRPARHGHRQRHATAPTDQIVALLLVRCHVNGPRRSR